ncbi:hypothetical protein FKW77_000777 [Venturia effusa]|uniref:Uncharacterized protein n=1 Tax=Venturia effusa TaxID=50376 RepID=A0A517LKS4_9PEZI|nr:hypothetical protein FKW77_000777 [Venturia effusa]
MEENINDMACRVQKACSATSPSTFAQVEDYVGRVHTALLQAQLSLANTSLFCLDRLKKYVAVSHECKSVLLELQQLIDYHSLPGLTRVREGGIFLISGNIQNRLQACINDLSGLDCLTVFEEHHLEHGHDDVSLPSIQITSPVSPLRGDRQETTISHTQTSGSSMPIPIMDSSAATFSNPTIEAEWSAAHAASAQRCSQPSLFQISLETVLEEFDDSQAQPISSRSSTSSLSSCSQRTISPPPTQSVHSSEQHRASIEILSEVSGPYIQHLCYGFDARSEALETMSDLQTCPSQEAFRPDFNQYSPSFQLERLKIPSLKPQDSSSVQLEPDNQYITEADVSSSSVVSNETNCTTQQSSNIAQSPFGENSLNSRIQIPSSQFASNAQSENEVAVIEDEISLAALSKDYITSVISGDRSSTSFVRPRSKYMSIVHCNNNRQNQSLPLPPSHPTFSERSQASPLSTPEMSSAITTRTQSGSSGAYPLNSGSRSFRYQSTDVAQLPFRSSLFTQSVPNLFSSSPTSSAPARHSPPIIDMNPTDDATQDIRVASSSRLVLINPLKSSKTSSRRLPLPPHSTLTLKTRKSFQRLSSMFHKKRVADSFFDYSD